VNEQLQTRFERIVNLIYFTEQAVRCCDQIAIHARAINEANYGHFFGGVQRALIEQAILKVLSLYATSRRHDLDSIPHLLKFLADKDLILRHGLDWHLDHINVDKSGFDKLTDDELRDYLLRYAEEKIAKIKTLKLYQEVKFLRDKLVAHSEMGTDGTILSIRPKSYDILLFYPKRIISAVGSSYFETQKIMETVGRDGQLEFLLDTDAARLTASTKRILKKLEVIENAKA
jgi:hypothetical protein